jgi:DNA-directed RNA polymerase specialized sigma24 family protein
VIKATFDDALRRLRPYATGLASTPMEYWLIRLAERNLRKLTGDAGKAKLKVAPAAKADREEDDLTIARRALSAVPTQDAFVLALALFEGMSAPEIALTLGVGQARAMKRLRNALAAISKQLPSAGGAA